jgi:Lrp/AsnC family transcriptional regulator, leucine-responsive regulatory protein
MQSESVRQHPDRVDRVILERLQVDGRMPNVELADAVALSPSACLRRVKSLEADGIIAGYRAEVDRARAGLNLTVFVEIEVAANSAGMPAQVARVEEGLRAVPAVVACYLVSGKADFFVEVAVPDLAAYEQLLFGQILTIPHVSFARSMFAIRTVIERGPLPLEHWA